MTALLLVGCAHQHAIPLADDSQPHELAKINLPEYVIEPPDILKIDALYLIPLPPYKIQSLDVLALRVTKTIPDEPISGLYGVEPDGTINLGFSYGTVKVAGLSLDDAKEAIKKQLKILKDPTVELYLAQGRGVQQIRGEHLVRPDGTVSLGTYGDVHLSGLTLSAAKQVIEAHLAKSLQKPEVTVDVLAFNSKVYYIVFDQGGMGQRIFRLPITGNETVLDALSTVTGLSVVADDKKMWLSRPTTDGEPTTVLPIDWHAVVAQGRSETNYQLLPGDRIYVQADKMVTFDTKVSRFLSPWERIFGFSLLGSGTVKSLQFRSSSSSSSN
jgi:polysaccharide export outer membrane protein